MCSRFLCRGSRVKKKDSGVCTQPSGCLIRAELIKTRGCTRGRVRACTVHGASVRLAERERERSFRFITAVIRFRRRCVFHCRARAGNECICATACSGRRVCGNDARKKLFLGGARRLFCSRANVTAAQGAQMTPESQQSLGVAKTGGTRARVLRQMTRGELLSC
jgi:hypothetical protein